MRYTRRGTVCRAPTGHIQNPVEELINARIARNGETKEAEIARINGIVPLGRIGTPEKFANVAVFLSSPAASFVNGVMLQVYGGIIQSTF
ncbi:MAG: SDR family oxidoreductase [Nostoc sp.]|uniref:SDR family oxidoreductase n=1 Tax=Nostoc sp. TaxID=1180 RepID=UPI002FF51D31